MVSFSLQQVNARSLRAHGLVDPLASIDEALVSSAGIYGTSPTSHLGLAARLEGYSPAELERLRLEERSIMRTPGPRGSVFLAPRALVPACLGLSRPRTARRVLLNDGLSEVVLDCELSADERLVYDSVRAATVRDVVDRLRSGGNVMAALEALLRLRQAACHASLVPGQTAESGTSSKLETLHARLEEAVADGHKALVFSQWTSLLDLVEPGLRERGIDWLRLDGSTRDRGAVVEGFQSESGPPVMLLSLRAGGTGLNLTAADHVFLLDPLWNPAVEQQAADRAHRIGQDRPVVLHRLIARNTVEEGILRLHARKRALADAALENADGSSRLTRDELVELLENA